MADEPPKPNTTTKSFSGVSQKKAFIASAIILIVLLIGGAIWLLRGDGKNIQSTSSPTINSTGQATSNVTGLDACSLLTEKEAEKAMGVTMRKAEITTSNNNPSTGRCVFQSNTNDPIKTVAIILSVERFADATKAKDSFDESSNVPQAKTESVPNLGQAAVWSRTAQQLIVLQSKYRLIVSAGTAQEHTKDKAIDIAKAILPRLDSLK